MVPPERPRRPREIVDRVRKDFDFVLVHGDRGFIPLEDSFPLAPEIEDKLIYTGYVAEPDETDNAGHRDRTPGREESSSRLAEAPSAVSCWQPPRDPPAGVLGEPKVAAALRAQSFRTGVCEARRDPPRGRDVLERYRPDFPQMLRRCRVSVSQAGYNTVLDLLAAGAAAVVVPFAAGQETEQSLRAERLAARGVFELVREDELSAECLASAINRAISKGPATVAIDTAGAKRSAELIAEMIRRRVVK